MLNMQRFHKSLFENPENPNAYLRTLKAVTKTSPEQLKAMTSDLGWQLWSAPKVDVLQA